MYIRMLSFESDPQHRAEMLQTMDTMMPKIRTMQGCKDVKFIMHDGGKFALLVFWDTRENADGAAPVMGPQLLPLLNKISKQPVAPLLYEVYEPMK